VRREALTVKQYREMGYEALHKELARLVARSNRTIMWLNRERQMQMLPALMAMDALVAAPGRRFPTPGLPNWEDECHLLGLNPATIRQWKKRTGAEADMRAMLGEEREPRARNVPPSLELHKLQMLVDAVLNDGDGD
jgi:hypothetical protein